VLHTIQLKKEHRGCSWPKKESSSNMGTVRRTVGCSRKDSVL